MLTSITWQVFLTTIFFVVLGYYAITSLLLYRGELKSWVTRKARPLPMHSPEEENTGSAPSDIMGQVNQRTVLEQHISTIADNDIAINSIDEVPEPIQIPRQGPAAQTDTILVGSVADLLEEIKTLVNLITEYKSSKAEATEFFHALFLRYPQLLNTTYQEAIDLYILDIAQNQFSFDLSLKDLASWWTTPRPSNK